MRLRTNNITPNIGSVLLDQADGQYTVSTKIKFISRKLATSSKDYFVLYCLSEELANRIIGSTSELSSYLNRKKTDSNLIVVHDIFEYDLAKSLVYMPDQQHISVTNKIVIDRSDINNLTIIVATARSLKLKKVKRYSPINRDVLSVLHEGHTPKNNIVLYEDLAQTDIWLGAFYRDLQGVYRKTNNDKLYVKQVPNTKVVFTSQANKSLFKTISNNFDSLFDFNKGLNSKDSIYNKLSTENTNYFSDLYFAKTKNLDLPLSFSFNKLSFYKNNTLFGRLIKNKTELLGAVELQSAKFLRKRVESFNPSSRLTAYGPTEDLERLETPVDLSPTYIDIFGNSKILTVQGTDKEIKDITYGLYQYGVEMTFIDRTAQKIKNLIEAESNGLVSSAAKIKNILAEASQSPNYDVYSQEFNLSYRTKYMSQYRLEVLTAIRNYVSVLAVFYENFSLSLQESPNSLALKIYDLTDPMLHGPTGLQSLIQILENLISELQIFIKSGSLKPGASQHQNTKTSKLGNSDRIIKKKYFFKQVVDADNLTNDGYDYLSTQPDLESAPRYANFRILSFQEFSQIKTVEMSKFDSLTFKDKDDIALTPNYFSLGGKPQPINLPQPEVPINNDAIATKILVAKAYRNSPIDFASGEIRNNETGDPNPKLQAIKNSVMLASKNSCVIQVNTDKRNSLFDSSEDLTVGNNYLDSAEKMSESSPFVVNKTGSVSLNNFLFSTANNNTEAQYLNKVKKLDINMLSYLVQSDYFNLGRSVLDKSVKNITDKKVFYSKNNSFASFNQQVLDQEKAKVARSTVMNSLLNTSSPTEEFYPMQELAYSNTLSSPISASQVANLALKYGNVRKVEYIAGFKQSKNTFFMGEPIWVPLTEGIYQNFFDAGKTLMCRFVEYSSLFSKYEGVKFPIYDEIFLIGRPPTSTSPTPQANVASFRSTPTVGKEAEYSFADMRGVVYDRAMTPAGDNVSPAQESVNTNLYTNGSDFLLPNGDKYVGYFHIHYDRRPRKFIAMVGKAHTEIPHDTLTPISNKARRMLKNAERDGARAPGGSY